jgi:hypothetical protein
VSSKCNCHAFSKLIVPIVLFWPSCLLLGLVSEQCAPQSHLWFQLYRLTPILLAFKLARKMNRNVFNYYILRF